MPLSNIQKLRCALNALRRKHRDDVPLDLRIRVIRENLDLMEKGEGGPDLFKQTGKNIAELAEYMKAEREVVDGHSLKGRDAAEERLGQGRQTRDQ